LSRRDCFGYWFAGCSAGLTVGYKAGFGEDLNGLILSRSDYYGWFEGYEAGFGEDLNGLILSRRDYFGG